MFANQTNSKPQLALAPATCLVEIRRTSTFPPPGESKFPSPPALPSALLRLECSLSAFGADLQDITDIIRSDIGLTTQLLRLAAREMEESPGQVVPIGDIVVHVGLEKLKALVAQTRALPDDVTGAAGLSTGERFWMHSRLIALLAEEIADRSSEIRIADAHMAGLLCHLGDLPLVMGWAARGADAGDCRQLGYRMANAWGFPRVLAEVISGDRGVCLTHESRTLLDIVTSADTWASRLKSLAVRESERRASTIHLVD